MCAGLCSIAAAVEDRRPFGGLADLGRHLLGLGPQIVPALDQRVPATEQILQPRQIKRVTPTSKPTNGLLTQIKQGPGIMHQQQPLKAGGWDAPQAKARNHGP